MSYWMMFVRRLYTSLPLVCRTCFRRKCRIFRPGDYFIPAKETVVFWKSRIFINRVTVNKDWFIEWSQSSCTISSIIYRMAAMSEGLSPFHTRGLRLTAFPLGSNFRSARRSIEYQLSLSRSWSVIPTVSLMVLLVHSCSKHSRLRCFFQWTREEGKLGAREEKSTPVPPLRASIKRRHASRL